jgi:hypothetical protein
VPPILLWGSTFGGLAIGLILAAWRGSWPERIAAITLFLDEFISGLSLDHYGWGGVQRGPFLADLILAVVLLAVAVRQPRIYLLILGSLAVTMVGVHVARLIPSPLHQAGYASALFLLTQAEVWTLVIGLALRQRTGSAKSWS